MNSTLRKQLLTFFPIVRLGLEQLTMFTVRSAHTNIQFQNLTLPSNKRAKIHLVVLIIKE